MQLLEILFLEGNTYNPPFLGDI